MAGRTVLLNIAGKDYSIKSDVSEETTRSIAAFVSKKMQEIKDSLTKKDSTTVAVLSAMNIAMELNECQERYDLIVKELDSLKNKSNTISEKIDNSLS